MSEKRSRTGLLSRLAAPIAKAARRVVRRTGDDDPDDEVRRLLEMTGGDLGQQPARLTDDAFRLASEDMLKEDDGAFQVKLHVISLVEFREAVGDKWFRVSDKVMMIAEGVINMHLGAGNVFGRQGSDFFVLLFRTCDNDEARRRAVTIAQELGTRLVGDQFLGDERPLALAAEVSLEDGFNLDGSLNLAAVHNAVGEMRSLIARQSTDDAPPPPAWMRAGKTEDDAGGPRRHLMPSAPAPKPKADTRPPIAVTGEPAPRKPVHDPVWKPLEGKERAPIKDPTWVILDVPGGERKATENIDEEGPNPEPLPGDARLSLLWRPTWVAAGETIGAYKAQLQRVDAEGRAPLEGVTAYPRGDDIAANALDRFAIASAIRSFRASETAGNGSAIVLPMHWLTLTSEKRMEFLAPFADVGEQARRARVVIDLFGVPADVKPMALGAAIQTAKALCRSVILRTRLSSPRTAMALDCGADMVGLDLSELARPERTDDEHLLGALKEFAAAATKARLGAYVWGVRRRKVIVGAVHAGFAMVNGPALMKDIPKPAKVLPAPKARFTAA